MSDANNLDEVTLTRFVPSDEGDGQGVWLVLPYRATTHPLAHLEARVDAALRALAEAHRKGSAPWR